MVRGEDAHLVNAWQRIVKQGRFKGLGCTLVSQRSASLNKDVLTQVDTLIVLRTTSPQDRAAVKAWVDVHADAGDMLATLPSLETARRGSGRRSSSASWSGSGSAGAAPSTPARPRRSARSAGAGDARRRRPGRHQGADGRDHREGQGRRPEGKTVRLKAEDTCRYHDTLTGPVRVWVRFTFERPPSHYRTGRNRHLLTAAAPAMPTLDKIGDLDKLIRAIFDALTDAEVWADDRLVVDVRARKVYAGEDELALDRAGVDVIVEPLAPPATVPVLEGEAGAGTVQPGQGVLL
jgi:Holliday junction resolvase RusA-like endonuclease